MPAIFVYFSLNWKSTIPSKTPSIFARTYSPVIIWHFYWYLSRSAQYLYLVTLLIVKISWKINQSRFCRHLCATSAIPTFLWTTNCSIFLIVPSLSRIALTLYFGKDQLFSTLLSLAEIKIRLSTIMLLSRA